MLKVVSSYIIILALGIKYLQNIIISTSFYAVIAMESQADALNQLSTDDLEGQVTISFVNQNLSMLSRFRNHHFNIFSEVSFTL